MSLKIVFSLAKSANSDKMPPYAAFDVGLHCLPHTCDTSRIMREAPEFKPYLTHSRAGNAISRISNFALMIFSQATIFTAIGTHF